MCIRDSFQGVVDSYLGLETLERTVRQAPKPWPGPHNRRPAQHDRRVPDRCCPLDEHRRRLFTLLGDVQSRRPLSGNAKTDTRDAFVIVNTAPAPRSIDTSKEILANEGSGRFR